MQHVRLVPLTPAYRELLFEEELANYADEHVRDAGWEPETALEQARLKLGPPRARACTGRRAEAAALDGAQLGGPS